METNDFLGSNRGHKSDKGGSDRELHDCNTHFQSYEKILFEPHTAKQHTKWDDERREIYLCVATKTFSSFEVCRRAAPFWWNLIGQEQSRASGKTERQNSALRWMHVIISRLELQRELQHGYSTIALKKPMHDLYSNILAVDPTCYTTRSLLLPTSMKNLKVANRASNYRRDTPSPSGTPRACYLHAVHCPLVAILTVLMKVSKEWRQQLIVLSWLVANLYPKD